MRKVTFPNKTTIKTKKPIEGERIKQKVKRIMNNKEPITDGAPILYTERKEGVKPEYDVRTDRFELAVEGMGKVAKMNLAKREERHKPTEGNQETQGGEGQA